MTDGSDDFLDGILDSIGRITHIRPDDIPNIDLYMDQVTTFMDRHLRDSVRNPEEDKILTKTMINNYAKNDLLPPPVKKKYSKEHILLLIFIYYDKSVLSINDIQSLLKPITDRYFGREGGITLEDIYNEIFGTQEEQIGRLTKQVQEIYGQAELLFGQAPEEEREKLRRFAFVCLLIYDVYVKKLLIEKMIDGMKE